MSSQFCPDCAAQINPGDKICPDCQFPLELLVHRDASGIHIREEKVWKRVSQVLKRGGLRIQQKSVPTAQAGWMALPVIGAVIFIASLLFGGQIVDQIWEPPKPVAQVLDLNQSEDTSTAAGESSNDESVAFLSDAFQTSDDQKQATFDNDVDVSEFIDRPKADQATIKANLEEVYLTMMVKNRKRRAILLNDQGIVLTDLSSLEGAFQREIITVNENHQIKERAIFVVPQLKTLQSSESEAESIRDDPNIGLGLLQTDFQPSLTSTVTFNHALDINHTVWIAQEISGKLYHEKAIIDDFYDIGENMQAWTLDSDLSVTNSGSPVLNQYGEVCGILLVRDGINIVIPFLTVRERAPLIYKNVLR